MLDPKVIELVDRMVRVQFEECEEQLQRDIIRAQNQAAKDGIGSSTAVVERVYDLCARDIETSRYAHGPGIDEPLAVERKGETLFYHATWC